MNIKYTSKKITNNFTMGVGRLPGSQSLTLSAYLEAGVRHDPPEKPGLAHLTEHMLLAGTKKYPSSRELSLQTASYGGWQSAFTWLDYQVHTVKIPKKYFSQAVDVLFESLRNPLLKESELIKEKKVVIEEVLMNKSDPERAIWDYGWNKVFWDSSYLARPYTGSEKDLNLITIEDVRKFANNLLESRCVIVVVGDLEEEMVYNKLNELFYAKLKKHKDDVVKKKVQGPSPGGKVRVFKNFKSENSHFIIGFKIPQLKDQNFAAVEIINNLLGGSFAGRLIDRLRDEGGYIFNWEIGQERLMGAGYIFFKSACKSSNLKQVIKIINQEFNKLKLSKIGKEELAIAKSQAIGNLLVNNETTDDYCRWYGTQEFFTRKARGIEKEVEIYKKISLEKIRLISQKYFRFDNCYLAVLGKGEEIRLKNIISKNLS